MCHVGQRSNDNSKITRRVRTDGFHVNKIRTIGDELFITRPTENFMTVDGSTNSRDGEGECEITEEASLGAGARINPNKAVNVDSIPGLAVRELVEKRTDKMLRVLNAVGNSGRIPAI